MSAATIAAALGDARREGRTWRCRCLLHGGRSLTLRDGDGGWLLAWCFGGCASRDVLAELHQRGLRNGETRAYRQSVARPQRHNDTAHRIACARRIWDGAHEALQSPVVRYLESRGITVAPPASLRWASHCWHRNERAYLPAMVGLVEHVDHGIVGVHRTYLTPDCCRRDRASLGPVGGGAVRLGDIRPDGWLCIAEGVETALSVTTACGIPAWAALSAGGIRALVLPPEATQVVLCADHDASGVGQRAAREAAARWLAEGRRVKLALPSRAGIDFNDILRGVASARIEEVRRVAD
jgi:putative DNA primase/helicase